MNKKKSLVIDTYNNRTPKKFLKKIYNFIFEWNKFSKKNIFDI